MPRSFLKLRPRTTEQARSLWTFVGAVLAVLTAWVGGGYAIAPGQVSKSPSFYIIKWLVPGGMRTHGIILLFLALAMAYAVLTPFDRRSVWVLRCFAFYAFLLAFTFFGSWIATGEIVWGGPAVWLGLGAIAEGMVILPPDSLTKEDHHHACRDLHGGRVN